MKYIFSKAYFTNIYTELDILRQIWGLYCTLYTVNKKHL